MSFLQTVGDWFLANEMIAILLSLAVGFFIGKIKIGNFTLGSTVGTLLVAMIIGQAGVFNVSSTARMLFFCLCVFVIGYESGPAFFASMKKSGLKVVVLSLFFVAAGLTIVIVMCKSFGLDQGTTAGIFAGSLTQTSVIATAGDAIASLGYDAATTEMLQSNVAIAYALTYFFGMAGIIVLIQKVEPALMRVDLKEEALSVAKKIGYVEEMEGEAAIKAEKPESDVTFICIGIILGLIIGGFTVAAGYIPLSLGSGVGVLIIGMIMGWLHKRNPKYGHIPAGARWFLKMFGLNMFIACTGLAAGANFIVAFQTMGIKILLIGLVCAAGPHLLTMFFGRKVLKMEVPDVLGTQCGASTIVAALNALIEKTGSSIFAVSYAPAYAIGNILLTVLGPVVVFLM